MAWCQASALLLLIIVGTSFSDVAACNWAEGSWVYDNTRPYYTGFSCPFVRGAQNCARHGRPDRAYQRLRWQPSGCVLQRFNPATFATLLRNKLVAVVGDSVSSNFAASLSCMANSGRVKLRPWSATLNGHRVEGYQYPGDNLRITAAGSNYLVKYKNAAPGKRVYQVELAQVDPAWAAWVHSTQVIIFQATHWYIQGAANEFYYNGRRLPGLGSAQAVQIGMATVKRFLKDTKYRGIPIFLTHSPSAYDLPAGVARRGTLCETTQRLSLGQTLYAQAHDPVGAAIAGYQKQVARGSNLRLIEVTHMSSFRPDSHLQNWYAAGGKEPRGGKDDCTHWCEAGVTDAWMDLVYNHLLGEAGLARRPGKNHAKPPRHVPKPR